MTRGDRVCVDYGDEWPACVCWPNGHTGTVLETIAGKAIIRLDEFAQQTTTVDIADLRRLEDGNRPEHR